LEGIRLETSTRNVKGYVVLDVAGEVDVYTAPNFKEALHKVIDDGQRHLIVNMEQVTYMDSSGFGTLLGALKRVRSDGGTVNLVKVSGAIDRMLNITRLNTIFNVLPSVEDAITKLDQQHSA